MVVEHHRNSTWRLPSSKLRHAPLGGSCGDIQGRECPPSTLPCTSRDIEMEFVRHSGSGSRSVGSGWEDMILPGREDPRNCVSPWSLGKSQWEQQLGKQECVFSLHNKMMSICPGVSQIYTDRRPVHLHYCSISVHLLLLVENVLGSCDRASLEMHLEAKIEWTERCTWRPWLSKFGDALRAYDRGSFEMHLQARIERDWRLTWMWSIWRRSMRGGRCEVPRLLRLYSSGS